MRNTTQRVFGIFVLCVVNGLLLSAVAAHAAETLTVTRDHFEFRDSPKVAEETLIGTLRAGTEIEWTGTMSGDWFEVRGPGNQVGWIHKSGLSAPKTAPTSQQRPVAAPAETSSSRSVPTRSPSTSTLQKQITELEKDNALYKALLDEKELRVTELSGDIEELEQKLLDTAQEASDTQQMRDMQQAQVTDLEAQVVELNAALEQKETELRKTNIELAKLQTQVNRARPQENLLVYGIYGVLGLLVFLLLWVAVWYLRRNASAHKAVAPSPDRQPEHLQPAISEQPEERKEQGEAAAPAPPLSTDNVYLDDEAEDLEDVEIELSDVLPVTDLDSPGSEETLEEVEDIEIVAENDLDIIDDLDALDQIDAVAGDIDVIEEIEGIEEDDVIEDLEIVEDIDVIENIATVEEIDTIEAADILGDIGDIGDIDDIDDIDDVDELEILDAPDAAGSNSETLENVFFNAPEDVSIYEELEERDEYLDIFDEEETGNDSNVEYDSIDEYEAEPMEGAADAQAAGEESVDIGGETYEMLVEQSTQIIETDDDLEEEVLMAPKAFEDVPDAEPEDLPTLKEEIEDLSDLLEAREMELEEIHGYDDDYDDYNDHDDHDDHDDADDVIDEELDDLMADLDDGQVQGVEIEDNEELEVVEVVEELEELEVVEAIDELDDFDEIDMIEEIEEIDNDIFEAEGEAVFESATTEYPDLLEPSPLLIEPENEPAVMLSESAEENDTVTAADESADTGPIYEIELVRVGNNTEQIIEFLSKVKGLPKPPEELVRTVPTIITSDAKETDAQNFQILMQKLGATVRVVKQ